MRYDSLCPARRDQPERRKVFYNAPQPTKAETQQAKVLRPRIRVLAPQPKRKMAASCAGGARVMVREDAFELQLKQARRSATVYWLAVAVYLLVYLFPVPYANGDTVFRNAGENRLLHVSQDWAPASSPDPVAILPNSNRPESGRADAVLPACCVARSTLLTGADFDSRGPPENFQV